MSRSDQMRARAQSVATGARRKYGDGWIVMHIVVDDTGGMDLEGSYQGLCMADAPAAAICLLRDIVLATLESPHPECPSCSARLDGARQALVALGDAEFLAENGLATQ